MNAQWKRTFALVAGTLVVAGGAAIAAWESYSMNRLGTAGLLFVADLEAKNNSSSPQHTRQAFAPGAVVMVIPGSPAQRAGVVPGDQVISVNDIVISEMKKLNVLESATRRGDVLVYRLRRGGNDITAAVRVDSLFASPSWLAQAATELAVGLVFLGVGWLVFWKKPDDVRSLVFYWLSMISTVVLFNVPIANSNFYTGRLGWQLSPFSHPRQLLGYAPIFLGSLLLPLLLHLALVFPREHRIVGKYPSVIAWIYWLPFFTYAGLLTMVVGALVATPNGLSKAGYAAGLVAVAVVIALVVFLRVQYLRQHPRPGWKAWTIRHPATTLLALCCGLFLLRLVTILVLHFAGAGTTVKVSVTLLIALVPGLLMLLNVFGYPVLTCLVLYSSYRESGAEEKRQLKWPLWGVIASQLGKVLLSLILLSVVYILGLKQFMSGPMLTTQQIVSALLAVLIPLSFAIAIFKYRLMQIDLIIKRTVLYSLLTGIIVSLYFVLVGGFGGLLVRFTGMKGESVAVLATVLVAAAFLPIRNRVQGMVDRRFFRKRHDYPQILKRLQEQMLEAGSPKALGALAVESVQQALSARLVAFFLSDEVGMFRIVAKIGLPDQSLAKINLHAGTSVRGLNGVCKTSELEWSEDELAVLQSAGIKILAGARFKNELLAVLGLGAKLSGEDYDADDLEFLTALADQVAAAIDNQRLREQERDVERGREIQQALLPKRIPSVDGYSIAGAWQPARRVSGDYYDIFALSNSKLALCIADVAGKGLPAALLMSNLQAAVKSVAADTVEPKKLCETVNRVICGNVVEGRFITFFFGLLDAPARRLVYTNAGHNPPLLVRGGGDVIRLEAGGPVLGVVENTAFEQGELELSAGDRLLLFTDGVSEAANAEQEEFGEDRLTTLLRSSSAENAEALQSRVMREVTHFCANRFQDDATVVVLVVEAQAASAAGAS
jgi:serine phosphatase RsbU (regulator of sigma subunit)